MEEIWKDIEGYEGIYQVNNLGDIRSLDRVINRKSGVPEKKKGRVLKLNHVAKRYYYISLHSEGSYVKKLVHRIVAETFIPNPEGKRTVNHINGVKTDNRVENLEWATYSENLQHAVDTELKITPKGNKNWKFGKRRGEASHAVKIINIKTEIVYNCILDAYEDSGLDISLSHFKNMIHPRRPYKNKTDFEYFEELRKPNGKTKNNSRTND